MRLVRYRHDNDIALVGVLENDHVRQIDMTSLEAAMDDLLALVRDWADHEPAGLPTLGPDLPLGEVRLLAPFPNPPRNIFCVGKNYREHADEFASSGYDATGGGPDAVPTHPIIFTKPASSIIGPDELIEPHPQLTSAIDYEAEIAVVIGTGGRDISRDAAMKHVWGYTLVNDITARDLQRQHKQWLLGKSLDTFCPMGPWAVTLDEFDGTDMSIQSHVNGELRQSANTRDLVFDIPDLIQTLSAGRTLQPGDIIATGTPAGVGIGFDPPRFLAPGDEVTISATRLGVLTNKVASA